MKLWLLALSVLISACSNGMSFNIAPPECSVAYESDDCRSSPNKPAPMADEAFFKREGR